MQKLCSKTNGIEKSINAASPPPKPVSALIAVRYGWRTLAGSACLLVGQRVDRILTGSLPCRIECSQARSNERDDPSAQPPLVRHLKSESGKARAHPKLEKLRAYDADHDARQRDEQRFAQHHVDDVKL